MKQYTVIMSYDGGKQYVSVPMASTANHAARQAQSEIDTEYDIDEIVVIQGAHAIVHRCRA